MRCIYGWKKVCFNAFDFNKRLMHQSLYKDQDQAADTDVYNIGNRFTRAIFPFTRIFYMKKCRVLSYINFSRSVSGCSSPVLNEVLNTSLAPSEFRWLLSWYSGIPLISLAHLLGQWNIPECDHEEVIDIRKGELYPLPIKMLYSVASSDSKARRNTMLMASPYRVL